MKTPQSDSPSASEPPRLLLDRFGLDERSLEGVLGSAVARGVDYADLYFEFSHRGELQPRGRLVKRATKDVAQGVGVRVVAGDKTGYALLRRRQPREPAHRGPNCACDRRQGITAPGRSRCTTQTLRARPLRPVATAAGGPLDDKIGAAQPHRRGGRRYDRRINNVLAIARHRSEDGPRRQLRPASSSATCSRCVRLNVTCIARTASKPPAGNLRRRRARRVRLSTRERSHLRVRPQGGGPGAPQLARDRRPRRFDDGRSRARAGPASCCTRPSGMGSRATSTAKRPRHSPGCSGSTSLRRCAPSSTMEPLRIAAARSTVDDEGTPTGRSVLIEKGILRGYLQDRLNARLMGMPPTGNGRRESFAHIPMPRMTNTFMLAGESPPEDIIRSVDLGSLRRLFRRRPGRHHQRQVRLLRQRGVSDRERPHHAAGQGGDVDRQRPRGAQADQHGRQRPRSSTRASAPAARTANRFPSASGCRPSASTI